MSINISGLSKVDLLESLWTGMNPARYYAFNPSQAHPFNKEDAGSGAFEKVVEGMREELKNTKS